MIQSPPRRDSGALISVPLEHEHFLRYLAEKNGGEFVRLGYSTPPAARPDDSRLKSNDGKPALPDTPLPSCGISPACQPAQPAVEVHRVLVNM